MNVKLWVLKVLGPDVNESNLKFNVNKDGNIRFGLGAVKGVGESAVRSIMEKERKTVRSPVFLIFVTNRLIRMLDNKKNIEVLPYPEVRQFSGNKKRTIFRSKQ